MAKIEVYRENSQSLGLNTLDDPVKLTPGESPYMLNMVIDRKGQVRKRFGYELATQIDSVTGAMRGAHAYYRTFGSNSGNYMLAAHNNGSLYYVTQANLETNTSMTSASTYGTDSGKVRFITFNNMAIFGNGLAANTVQKWEGTGNSANLSGTPNDAYIFSVFQDRLFGVTKAAPTTVIFSAAGDPESQFDSTNATAIDRGNGEDIKAMIKSNDNLIILKEDSKYAMNILYDDSAVVTVPKVQPVVDSSGGCIAADSAVAVYTDIFYLSQKGFQAWGNLENYSYRAPRSISWQIKPDVETINVSDSDLIDAVFYDEKYMCVAPIGKTSIPYVFVYDTIQKGWTIWNNINAIRFIKFKNSKGGYDLFFASDSEPKIFKFNNTFSDDGAPYTGAWRSRTWRFGTKTKWNYLDLYGSKTQGSTINLSVNVDNVVYRDTITDSNLMLTATGNGYIGDNYLGQNYIGGAISGTPMYKWHYRFYFHDTVNYGRDMYFELSNNQDGHGFSFQTDYNVAVEKITEINTYDSSTNNS